MERRPLIVQPTTTVGDPGQRPPPGLPKGNADTTFPAPISVAVSVLKVSIGRHVR